MGNLVFALLLAVPPPQGRDKWMLFPILWERSHILHSTLHSVFIHQIERSVITGFLRLLIEKSETTIRSAAPFARRSATVDLPDPCIGEITNNYPRMVDRDLNELRLYDTPTLCQIRGSHWPMIARAHSKKYWKKQKRSNVFLGNGFANQVTVLEKKWARHSCL